MMHSTDRVVSSTALGRAGMVGDIGLGLMALAPLFICAGLGFVATVPAILPRTLAVIWACGLLSFFAGVRRGLSFSERGGARPSEVATFLTLFGVGIVSMVLCSPALAAAGLVMVGALDAWAAHRGEAPAYFTAFRPIQMALGAAAMLLVQMRVG